VTCCGADRTTRHCPDCGKRLNDSNDLNGLLAQCKRTAEKMFTEANRFELDGKPDARVLSAKRSSEKWSEWARLLEELMKGGKT
jgi:hypothetical protein